MKPALSHIKISLLVFSACFLMQCRDPEGVFHLSEDARKYMIDTTINTFIMVEFLHTSDEFMLLDYSHHYLEPCGIGGKAFGEAFSASYYSTQNEINFQYNLRAGIESSCLMMEWNNYDRFSYDFSTQEVSSSDYYDDSGDSIVIRKSVMPAIALYSELDVRGRLYKDIIEINYAGKQDSIEDKTPVISYFSGEKGLIKFIMKNGIIYERRSGFDAKSSQE